MQINKEKILIHANERLTVVGAGAERAAQVEVFKKFLKIENERLRIRHRFGLGGGEITSGRSYMVDLVVCRACQLAACDADSSEDELSSCAVVALGGYGRRELAPSSDVDILFLHAGKRSKGVKRFIEHVLYLLWDIGLTVGHSFRSVSDCVSMGREDLHSRNAMSEARLITGNAHLFRRLARGLEESVFKNRRETDAFLESMRVEMEARYEKFGRTVCLQEPNVKESAGGLRDLHSVVWVGHALYGTKALDDLRAEDHISGAEYASARRAYDFIARVRNEAHFSTGRKTDLLTLDLQPQLASSLGYKFKRGLLASELFMRDYYQRANDLHQFCRSFLTRAMGARDEARRVSPRIKQAVGSFELRQGKFYLTIKRSGGRSGSLASSFEIKRGKLYLKDEPSDFRANPMRLIEIFSTAQRERVDLSDELKMAVRGNLQVVERSFRASKEAGAAFIEILRRKGRVASVLRMMYETGFLGRFLPEFARITFLVQHDFYHKYTIDEHTLKAIETLDQLAGEGDAKLSRIGKVFRELEDVAPLYLGLLLHDIGKGHGGGHVSKGVRIAERTCRRLGLDEDSIQEVLFLVKQHLLMSHLSQRRDITEENLIEGFVETVGKLDRLGRLLLLTYADTSAVGPGVWNDWKGALLWELYTRSRSHLTGGRQARWDYNRTTLIKQQAMRELFPDYLPSEVERHFAMLPERYIRATEPSDMVRDFRLTRAIESGPLAAEWRVIEEKRCSELTVCARDGAGLFARIAGTLTAAGINILSADLYTREDGIVLDTFKLSQAGEHNPVRQERWPKIERSVRAAIEGRYDVAAAVEHWLLQSPRRHNLRSGHALISPVVRFDLEASASSTVIEVKAEDEPGLAYKIANTLAALDLNISFARITTEKRFALDIFYVTDARGQKLGLVNLPVVEGALLEALGGKLNSKLNKEAV